MYVGIEKSTSENAINVLRKCALRLTGIFYSNIFTQVNLLSIVYEIKLEKFVGAR
jgi:hypothetical protein